MKSGPASYSNKRKWHFWRWDVE